MYDWSARRHQGTPRRGYAADEDALHAMGFHDCALEALRFLTERARLDPDSAVVQDVRGLLDGPTDAAPVPRAAAGSTADINVHSDVRRVRRRTSNISEGENRSLTARRCLHGRVRSQRSRSRCQRRFTANVDDGLLTSPSLSGCAAVINRPARSTTSVRGDDGRRQCPLRTLQTAAASNSSPSTVSADVQFCQDVDVTTASDVVECAAMLVDLARRDDRVRNVLTELLQLME